MTKKYLSANQNKFMTKEFHKTVRFDLYCTINNWHKKFYNKHRYYSVNLLCKIKKNKRNHKSFNHHNYSLFFLKVIFPRRLWLIPNTLKWKDCKILTKFVPWQTSSKDLQNLIITSSSDFRRDIVFCIITNYIDTKFCKGPFLSK